MFCFEIMYECVRPLCPPPPQPISHSRTTHNLLFKGPVQLGPGRRVLCPAAALGEGTQRISAGPHTNALGVKTCLGKTHIKK